MRIIAKSALRAFWLRRADAERPLSAWYEDARAADWDGPAAVKASYRHASLVAGNRIVFNIGGNKYRLVVKASYPHRILFVRFVGTHAGYDVIDVETI